MRAATAQWPEWGVCKSGGCHLSRPGLCAYYSLLGPNASPPMTDRCRPSAGCESRHVPLAVSIYCLDWLCCWLATFGLASSPPPRDLPMCCHLFLMHVWSLSIPSQCLPAGFRPPLRNCLRVFIKILALLHVRCDLFSNLSIDRCGSMAASATRARSGVSQEEAPIGLPISQSDIGNPPISSQECPEHPIAPEVVVA